MTTLIMTLHLYLQPDVVAVQTFYPKFVTLVGETHPPSPGTTFLGLPLSASLQACIHSDGFRDRQSGVRCLLPICTQSGDVPWWKPQVLAARAARAARWCSTARPSRSVSSTQVRASDAPHHMILCSIAIGQVHYAARPCYAVNAWLALLASACCQLYCVSFMIFGGCGHASMAVQPLWYCMWQGCARPPPEPTDLQQKTSIQFLHCFLQLQRSKRELLAAAPAVLALAAGSCWYILRSMSRRLTMYTVYARHVHALLATPVIYAMHPTPDIVWLNVHVSI